MAKKEKIAVVVTDKNRGVTFGYLEKPHDGSTIIRLANARMCIKWVNTRGLPGLAAAGPNNECRISPAVPAWTIHEVTSVMECTPEAAEAWEKAPWN
jgi:hypothetical protein